MDAGVTAMAGWKIRFLNRSITSNAATQSSPRTGINRNGQIPMPLSATLRSWAEKLLIATLGEDYVSRMFAAYDGRVPREADLVCYWFEKAGKQIASGTSTRVGLVATNSIRGGANRRALRAATEKGRIFNAWSDEAWVIDGAAVRVSLVCYSGKDDGFISGVRLDGNKVDEIYTDLTARSGSTGFDITKVGRLTENAHVAFMGNTKAGPFDVSGDQARDWLCLPTNPNGRTNTDVLKPWINGMDVTRRPSGKWIVDFGWTISASDAALYEEPFRWVQERVYPVRMESRQEAKSKVLVAAHATTPWTVAGA